MRAQQARFICCRSMSEDVGYTEQLCNVFREHCLFHDVLCRTSLNTVSVVS